jgi:hypothetical protein
MIAMCPSQSNPVDLLVTTNTSTQPLLAGDESNSADKNGEDGEEFKSNGDVDVQPVMS